MFKFNRDKFKGFGIGVIATLLCMSLVGTAYAAGQLKTIKIMEGGIKLYVDGKLVKPTDVKGNVIEPFIYDGTTYLPLRALSNVLTNNEKEVAWDSKTSTIYIGQAPVAAQTEIDKLSMYESKPSYDLRTGEKASFRILDKTITPFNSFESNGYYTYLLNSNYSKLHAKFVVPYTILGSTDVGTVMFYNVDRYGVETQITAFKAVAGDDVMDIEVDLSGVAILKIYTSGYDDNNKLYGYGNLYNVTLEGIK